MQTLFKQNCARSVCLCMVEPFLGLSFCSAASGNNASKAWYCKQSLCFTSVLLLWFILISMQLEEKRNKPLAITLLSEQCLL